MYMLHIHDKIVKKYNYIMNWLDLQAKQLIEK